MKIQQMSTISNMAEQNRNSLIEGYFKLGMRDRGIWYILQHEHGITISIRHVKRIRKLNHLSNRQYSNPVDVVDFIQSELEGSGQLHGYRIMHAKCLQMRINVRMEDVRMLLRQLDPLGVELRKSRRLLRRAYFANGPNYIWHIDGYDKLKPFGLAIHGCICGYSRKIIWLHVYHTNNNPKIVGGYFMNAVKECQGCPRIVRGDCGTENGHVRDFQKFLRREGRDPQIEMCYIDGASTANQRIEGWWAFLRKETIHFWLDKFRDLAAVGDFTGDPLDKNLVRFCFMALLQNELDAIAQVWNSHTIRPSRNPRVPSGRPVEMYHAPMLWNVDDQICPVSENDLKDCTEECEFRSTITCDAEVYEACIEIMNINDLEPADNFSDAVDFYLYLRNHIRR